MTKAEHPIAHRNPELILDLCYAVDPDPMTIGELKAIVRDQGHKQADATITKTIDDLVTLGALRKVRHFNRRTSAITYSLELTDLGRCWLNPGAVDVPILERKDAGGYRWTDPPPPDEPDPPPTS